MQDYLSLKHALYLLILQFFIALPKHSIPLKNFLCYKLTSHEKKLSAQ